MENFDLYLPIGISEYQNEIFLYAQKWKEKNKDDIAKSEYVDIVLQNTFSNLYNKISASHLFQDQKRTTDQNWANTLAKFISSRVKSVFFKGITNKGKPYLEIAISKNLEHAHPVAQYIADVRNYVNDTNRASIREIRIFCNIDLEEYSEYIRVMLESIIDNDIPATYFTNYSHANLYNSLKVRKGGMKKLQFIFSDREKYIPHYVALIKMKKTPLGIKISKYDETSNIKIKLDKSERTITNSVAKSFIKHHWNRMQKIEDGVMNSDKEYKESNFKSNENERHTILLNDTSIIPSRDRVRAEIVKLAQMQFSNEGKEQIKYQRNLCLSLFNQLHVLEKGTDMTLYRSVLLTIYSLHLLEERSNEKEQERIKSILDDREDNKIIWESLRRFDKYIDRDTDFPLINDLETLNRVLKIVHFGTEQLPPLSKVFREIPFSADKQSLQESLGKLIRDSDLRLRLKYFLGIEENGEFNRKKAIEALHDLLSRVPIQEL